MNTESAFKGMDDNQILAEYRLAADNVSSGKELTARTKIAIKEWKRASNGVDDKELAPETVRVFGMYEDVVRALGFKTPMSYNGVKHRDVVNRARLLYGEHVSV